MPSSGMWRRVYLVWTDVSEERITSIFRVVNPRARNQREQVAADSVRTRFTRRHIPENGILHTHRYENLKFYIVLCSLRLVVACLSSYGLQ
jgi:hypothetical protein